MKTMFVWFLSLVLLLGLTSCYTVLVEEVTEAIPMQQTDAVLIAGYTAKYNGAYKTVDSAYVGAVAGMSPEVLNGIASLMSVPGLVTTVGEMYKATFATAVYKELEKSPFQPYAVRQIRTWGKFGTGSRTMGSVGNITIPLSVDGTQKPK